MRVIPVDIQSALDSGVFRACTIWAITCRNGTVLRSTDWPSDIVYSGNTYKSLAGFERQAVEFTEGLSTSDTDVSGYFNSMGITQDALLSGIYDFADIDVRIVFPGYLSSGDIQLLYGNVGNIESVRGEFKATLTMADTKFDVMAPDLTSPDCRADLGDTKCKIDLTPYTVLTTISSIVGDNLTFTVPVALSSPSQAVFSFGTVQFTSGTNSGLGYEMHSATVSNGVTEVVLKMKPAFIIAVGDNLTINPGCDKKITTCNSTYSNVVNFRAEPHLPGIDKMNDITQI